MLIAKFGGSCAAEGIAAAERRFAIVLPEQYKNFFARQGKNSQEYLVYFKNF